ncbi:hypothetical protein [Pararhizobium sp.]|uniref:hypothetical protein n=1 Tax=Pararhizobium sp. TaxID=1977563 RepID=UPI00271593BA|nr:hypothetical protein [Pararhizobium sp.]MDO9415109.1 hypothetical protein [Pararhizobium sp.]
MDQKTAETSRNSTQQGSFDRRDRLILALWAQLRAERETRDALEETIRNGALSEDVLVAIASDPVPVITSEDIAEVERFAASQQRPPAALPKKSR